MNAASGAMIALEDPPPPPHPEASIETMQITLKTTFDLDFMIAENTCNITLTPSDRLDFMSI